MAGRDPARPEGAQQPLVGVRSNEEWDALLVHVNGLIQQMEALPPGEHKDRVFALLDGIDAIHREALMRLVRLFKEGVLEKVSSDPAIHTLLELYDLLPEPLEKAADPPARKTAFTSIPIKVLGTASPTHGRFPHWVPVLKHLDELAPGQVRELEADGRLIVLCRRGGEVFALASECALDRAPLGQATLSGYTLSCPSHPGCHYDVRQGARIGGGGKIPCFPVRLDEDGRVLVGLDMDFTPNLPSF